MTPGSPFSVRLAQNTSGRVPACMNPCRELDSIWQSLFSALTWVVRPNTLGALLHVVGFGVRVWRVVPRPSTMLGGSPGIGSTRLQGQFWRELPSVPLENLEISERMRVTSFMISSMLTALMTLLVTLSSIFRSRAALQLENLALRHQIGVLGRVAAKRLKLTSADRLLWICLSRVWRGWRSALTIVKPETVIAWHRAGFRLFWTWKVRRGQPGRPIISPEVRALIRKMCRENPSWGAPRIRCELLKLGINVGESSVSKYMLRSRKPPSQTWRTFLEIHAKQLGRGRDISCLMPPAQIRTGAR
jgi:hypothetical protein